jgi:catechol 2,3-dioxygenase-like lactoylglutathione lyase family enzyme
VVRRRARPRCRGHGRPVHRARVTDDLTIQLAPFGTEGGYHLAFAFDGPAFAAALARIRDLGIEYGDSFHDVGNMQGPGIEAGARGDGPSVYVFDPSRHLVEIRTYDAA